LAATTLRGADLGVRRAVRSRGFGFVIAGSEGFAWASASSGGLSGCAAAVVSAAIATAGAEGAMNGCIAVSNSIFCGHLCSDRMRRVDVSIAVALLSMGGSPGRHQFATTSIASNTPATTTKYRTRGTDPALLLTAALQQDKCRVAARFQVFCRSAGKTSPEVLAAHAFAICRERGHGLHRLLRAWRGKMVFKRDGQIVESAREARQAERGPSVRNLLLASTALAIIALGIVWLVFFKT
jgi:hypothetical protein